MFFLAHDLYWKTATLFGIMREAEKKCAASPGGTSWILFQALSISSPFPKAARQGC
jgi:hypothetical protein